MANISNLRPAKPGEVRNKLGINAWVRRRDMLRALAVEFGELSPGERVAVDQIAELLKIAGKTQSDIVFIRAHNSVARLVARIRAGRALGQRRQRAQLADMTLP